MTKNDECKFSTKYVFTLDWQTLYCNIEVKKDGIELSCEDQDGIRVANSLDDQKDLLFLMRSIDEQGFSIMLEENKEISDFIATFGGSMKLLVDRINNKGIGTFGADNLMGKWDNVSNIFSTQSLKDLIKNQGEEYYAGFCENPSETMRIINFYNNIEEFVEVYLVGKLSSMGKNYVEEVTYAQGDDSVMSDCTAYLYKQFEVLLLNARRKLSKLFVNPMGDVAVTPDDYINNIMLFIYNEGYRYLESISKSNSENISNATNNRVVFGG